MKHLDENFKHSALRFHDLRTLKWIGIIVPFIVSTWYRLPHADVDAISPTEY